MPPEILLLLEDPEVRDLLLDFVLWLLSQTMKNPEFVPQLTDYITQLKNPLLTIVERQAILVKVDALRATA